MTKRTLLGTCRPNFRSIGRAEHFQKNLAMEAGLYEANLHYILFCELDYIQNANINN